MTGRVRIPNLFLPAVLTALWTACAGSEAPLVADAGTGAPEVTWTTIEGSKGARGDLERAVEQSPHTPVLFVGATWCGTCQAYKSARSDACMARAHDGIHIIEVDAERHVKLIEAVQIQPAGVPHWEVLGPHARPVGASVDGRAWTLNTVGGMSTALGEFFDAHRAPGR